MMTYLKGLGTGELAYWLQTLAALAEDLGLSPAPTGQPTTVYNPSSEDPGTSSGHQKTHVMQTYMHAGKDTCTCKIKINLKKHFVNKDFFLLLKCLVFFISFIISLRDYTLNYSIE